MRVLILASFVLLSACIPYTHDVWISVPLAQQQVAPGADERVRVGETVIVDTLRKTTHKFRITRLDPDGFAGVARDGKTYSVRYADVESLWVKRSRWTTL